MSAMELITKRLSKSIHDSLVYSDGLSIDSIISELDEIKSKILNQT